MCASGEIFNFSDQRDQQRRNLRCSHFSGDDASTSAATSAAIVQFQTLQQRQQRSLERRCSSDDAAALATVMTASAAVLCAHRQLMTALATAYAIGSNVGDDSSSLSNNDSSSMCIISNSPTTIQQHAIHASVAAQPSAVCGSSSTRRHAISVPKAHRQRFQ
jgi:hypothetical protein